MRMQIICAMLALAATGISAQIATGMDLQDVRFKVDTRLDGVDLKKCASDLKSIYEPSMARLHYLTFKTAM